MEEVGLQDHKDKVVQQDKMAVMVALVLLVTEEPMGKQGQQEPMEELELQEEMEMMVQQVEMEEQDLQEVMGIQVLLVQMAELEPLEGMGLMEDLVQLVMLVGMGKQVLQE